MATAFPTHIGFPPEKDRNDVSRTMITSHGSIFKTTNPNDRENNDGRIKTETVWETMNPYTRTSEDSASTATPSSRRTRIVATPNTTTKNEATYSTASPTNVQSPSPLIATFHDSRGWSDGDIAAVVLGVVVCLAAIALAVWFFVYKRRRSPMVHRVTPPQTPTFNPSPPSSPLPTPPPVAELSSQGDQTSNMEGSWVSYGDRVRSPTPQPAVAEVKSFTRTWQKPRVYTVTGGRIAELQGSKLSASLGNGDDGVSPTSPIPRAESSRAHGFIVGPMTLTSRFSPLSSRTDPGGEQEESPRRGL
ncbi:hypothetical protein FPOA_08208 [Fusarium poae]|uniref:Uncharacterized protein n=1 Tax=Fusarium poae TaxID=36050 RepID=A0A1B8AMW1_FUSPO|nr:hypothetical protein FPOA_08208 [Fusarium poae]